MNINQYMTDYRDGFLVKPIECKDGLTLSVQASSFNYCSPRNDIGPWCEVEIGFPSERVEEIMPWAENPDSPCETVYGYVPIEVVEQVIENHGGLA